jgi:hypothetical protein
VSIENPFLSIVVLTVFLGGTLLVFGQCYRFGPAVCAAAALLVFVAFVLAALFVIPELARGGRSYPIGLVCTTLCTGRAALKILMAYVPGNSTTSIY